MGSWLPVVRTVYPLTDDECWEVVSFAKHEGASTFLQPTWYRFVKLKAGRVETVKYVDSYIPYPEQAFRSADFYRSLLSAHTYWQEALRGSMRLRAPEDWVEPFCRHAIALEMITRIGDHPKYGVVERAYAGSEHDGFQDELTSTVTCALEWGLFSRARGYLDYYFKHFVRQDGTLKYRGPEIGKYGVMLSCMAQYYEYTEDGSLLGEHDQKLRAIVALLVGRWEEARRLGPANPAYGMLKGYHEADITFLRAWESEVRNVSENPYQLTGGPGEPLPDVARGGSWRDRLRTALPLQQRRSLAGVTRYRQGLAACRQQTGRCGDGGERRDAGAVRRPLVCRCPARDRTLMDRQGRRPGAADNCRLLDVLLGGTVPSFPGIVRREPGVVRAAALRGGTERDGDQDHGNRSRTRRHDPGHLQ